VARPAIFLDRNGTLIREPDYPLDPDSVELERGVDRALHRLRGAGFHLVVVTNQSGLARGLFTEAEYRAVAARVEALLAGAGVRPDHVEFCPHHPAVSGPCDCRKPGVGMHRRAAQVLDIDFGRSWCVGDQVRDLLPARKLGMAGALLVRTGHGSEEAPAAPPGFPVVPDLDAASRLIVEAHPGPPRARPRGAEPP
jgi:D-glycero-D-manno-heptose 1,7-bisphosphate phosphatase